MRPPREKRIRRPQGPNHAGNGNKARILADKALMGDLYVLQKTVEKYHAETTLTFVRDATAMLLEVQALVDNWRANALAHGRKVPELFAVLKAGQCILTDEPEKV